MTRFLVFPFALILSFYTFASAQVTNEKTFDMGGYTVDRPPGEGWKIAITKKEQRIDFSLEITDSEGNPSSAKNIRVKTQWAKDKSMWKLSKEEIAKRYFEHERVGLRLSSTLGGLQFEEGEGKEEIIQAGDKNLYKAYMKQTSTRNDIIIEQIMYLYFPQNYKNDDKFIIFLISEGYRSESNDSPDLSYILPVIKSLQVDTGKLNE